MTAITKAEIKSLAEKYYDRKSFSASDIVARYIEEKYGNTEDGIFTETVDDTKLKADVSRILNGDIKSSDAATRVFRNGKNKAGKTVKTLYSLVKKTIPSSPSDSSAVNTLYLGKAGEYAVMSELLLRGYNANSMTIDDGIDVVASKDNIIYYYQVKTTNLDEKGCAYPPGIKKGGYDNYIQTNMRYVFAIRTSKGIVFLVFGNGDIYNLKYMKCLREDLDCIYLKFRFNDDGSIVAYHEGNTIDVSWSIDKFR